VIYYNNKKERIVLSSVGHWSKMLFKSWAGSSKFDLSWTKTVV